MPRNYKPCYCLLAMLAIVTHLSAQTNFNFDLEQYNKETGRPLGWGGNVILPDTSTKQSGKRSILLEKPKENFGVANYKVLSTFDGEKITLTGYIKTENVTDGYAGLWLRIDGGEGEMLELDNMGRRGITGTTDWTKYTIELPHHKEDAYQIYFGGLITGTGKMWIDNFQLLADGTPVDQAAAKKVVLKRAKTDTAFASGSGINSISLTKQTIDNLTNLGMLWGFLKYHHPAIAKGDYNWDAELFRVLPNILAAKNKREANALLEKWVDALPKPDSCHTCKGIQKDSSIKLLPDYGYLFNKSNFSESMIAKLSYIKDNRNQDKHYYIGMMTPGAGQPDFKNENKYASMTSPDAGYRLLALYRYWNMIQYYFPYKHLIGENWNKVLTEFIPEFVKANDGTAYHVSCLRLIARVQDTHANVWGSNKVLNDYFGSYAAIVQTRFIEDKLVVTGYYKDTNNITSTIKKGDVIIKINRVKVEELVKKFLPEIPASNYETQLRDLPIKLLRGHTDKVELEIDHEGQLQTFTVDRLAMNKLNWRIDYDPAPADSSYKLIKGDIGYVFPGKYKNKQLPAIRELFKNTKGIVVDMRCYPSEFMPFTFGGFIKSSASPFVKFTGGSVSTPGLFVMGKELNNGGDSVTYKGKIVVIVNSSTQSQAEYTTMAFQSSPNVTVIGSTTAGADGNVAPIYLPGNIFTWISGIGVYYPDGTETQRTGVRIDVPIKPTIKGIKEGRDELLEKAIAVIEGK